MIDRATRVAFTVQTKKITINDQMNDPARRTPKAVHTVT